MSNNPRKYHIHKIEIKSKEKSCYDDNKSRAVDFIPRGPGYLFEFRSYLSQKRNEPLIPSFLRTHSL